MDAPNVDASGNRTNDCIGFVVVLGQAIVLAGVDQHARSAIKDKARKQKLVFIHHFRSIFFSINLVNVTILCFVV
jgi:hypothetical protein